MVRGATPWSAIKIEVEDFAKVEIKVGKVLESNYVEGADKLLVSKIKIGDGFRKLVKGAPEYVLKLCDLTDSQAQKIFSLMEKHQKFQKEAMDR